MRKMILGLILTVSSLYACGTQRAPIDRVQPNYLDKQELIGSWYYGKTVIDAPYGAGYTFVGEQSPLYKIEWDIQERYLIARRTHAHVTGAEPEGISGGTEVGNTVAMYRIERHFDIARDYNPITGEENNILVENSYDRPWFDRQYIRVDWSSNLITDNELLIFGRVFHGIQFEPVSYFIPEGSENEAPHPHAPKFSRQGENNQLHYMDIVNKVFVRPTTTFFEDFGEVPDCYLAWNSIQNCSSNDITVRNSFLKLDENNDYEPMNYTGDRMRRFGYFVTDRPGYTEEYGPVDEARVRLVNRHNIWQASHQKNEDDTWLLCTESNAQDTCGGHGARCDIEWGRANGYWSIDGTIQGACTVPYRSRNIKTVAYHLSPRFPAELQDAATQVIGEWNEAFVHTAASLRENECLNGGQDAEVCVVERTIDEEVLVLCHNPVNKDDHAACGPEGTEAQIGDLRYNMLGWVTEPNSFSPLGYGPSMADPETGELIQGTALIYGAALEHVASFSRDILALLTGDLSEEEVMLGANVSDWLNAQRTGSDGDIRREHHIGFDGSHTARIDEAMDFSWHPAHANSSAQNMQTEPTSLRAFFERAAGSLQKLSHQGVFGQGQAGAKLETLKGSDIEYLMTGPEMRVAAAVPVDHSLTNSIMEKASPLRGLSPRHLRDGQSSTTVIQKHACILNADFADDGMLGLAREIKRAIDEGQTVLDWDGVSYPIADANGKVDYDQIRRMFRRIVLVSVATHEMGHTLGLRHNFSGSFDSLNYHPEYWRLRNDGNMAPRAWDPLSQAEINERISEYAYSTVMDYGNSFVASDTHGLGHYDKAAIKMGYGDMVEVFNAAPDSLAVNLIHAFQRGDWPVAFKIESFYDQEAVAYQYTDMPDVLGNLAALEERVDVAYPSLRPDPFLLENAGVTDNIQDAFGRPSVPYRFCSDEEVGLRPECQQFDSGADVYESVNSVIDTYWNHHIFDAFRRGRVGFQTQWHAEKLYGRYFSKLKNVNQIYVLFRSVITDVFGPEYTQELWTRPDGMGAWTTAVGSAFQLLTQVVTTPEPGTYKAATRLDGSDALTLQTVIPETVDSFEGRFLESTWDYAAGYYWFDQLESVGFYYDKVAALQILTDPEGYFLGRDTATDLRQYQINFYNTFGPSLTSMMRGLLGEDWDTIAPRLTESGTLVYPDPLNLIERDMDGLPLDPNASFSIQLFASVYGLANIPAGFDQSFINSARIFIAGGAESMDFPNTSSLVEFIEPESGITYRAVSYLDAKGDETGIGAQMLGHAKRLAANGAQFELNRYMDNIDLIRRLGWHFSLGQSTSH